MFVFIAKWYINFCLNDTVGSSEIKEIYLLQLKQIIVSVFLFFKNVTYFQGIWIYYLEHFIEDHLFYLVWVVFFSCKNYSRIKEKFFVLWKHKESEMRKLMNGQIFVMIYLSIIIFFIRKVSKSIHTHGYTNVHTYVIALNLLCSIDFFFCIIFFS